MEAPGPRRARAPLPHSPGPAPRRTARGQHPAPFIKRRRSSSRSSGGSVSPPAHKGGSPARTSTSPGPQHHHQQHRARPHDRSRRERHDHPRQERNERRHRDHSEGNEHRHKKDGDRERRREGTDRGRAHSKKNGGPRTEPGLSGRDREVQQLNEQQVEREFHNERRRQNRDRALGAENPETEPNSSQASGGNAAQVKEEPNFELSGALVEDTNTFRGVVIKYNEPPESRIPRKRWRLYPFKNDEPLPVMHIHRQSAYLLGRQRRIVDIPIDHPSCSKQHAVLQYRLVQFTRGNGTPGRRVRPYIIDLGSANGTYLNNQRIEVQRYYELREKDVLKFGFSSREYVILHEFSDTAEVDAQQEHDDDDDDHEEEEEEEEEDGEVES
ncbi:smad nuclear-interacting protein 1 [Rhinoraja longicauda]